jgi:hypothetical protein
VSIIAGYSIGKDLILSNPRQIKDIEKALTIQAQGKATLLQKLLDPLLYRKALTFGLPIVIVSGVATGIANLDNYLFENPDIENELLAKSQAYSEDLLDMSNPWGTFSADDPSGSLMSFMLGADPILKKRFREALGKVAPDRLASLALMLNTMELSNAQRTQFANLLIVVMSSEKAMQNISRALDIFEKLGTVSTAGPVADIDSTELVNKEGLSTGLLSSQLTKKSIAPQSILLGFLDIEEPEGLSNLMEALLELPERSYVDVMGVVSSLSPKYANYLVNLFGELNVTQTNTIIRFTENVSPRNLPPILDRLIPMSTSQVFATIRVLNTVSPSDLNTLIKLTGQFKQSEFDSMLSIIGKTSTYEFKSLLFVGKSLNSNVFASATTMTDSFSGAYVTKAIDIMSNLAPIAISDLVLMEGKLSSQTAEKGLDVLTNLRNASIQADLLQEANTLETSNLEKSVEVMDQVKTVTVESMIEISKGLTQSNHKNKLASQLFRIIQAKPDNDIRGTSYDVRAPVAVAGARGKARQTATSTTTTYSPHYPYQPPSLTSESKKQKITRVEKLVQKVVDIADTKLTEDLLDASDPLDDRGLVRGADVYIDLDLGSDRQRAHRLVDTYKRSDKHMRTSAIDTLHDIDTLHVNAAIDMAHQADLELMKESIIYTERLKYRLGEDEGLRATERVINVASRVDTNQDRRRGLLALSKEREVRVRRILKQVDGNTEPAYLDAPTGSTARILFTGTRINTITELYHELDTQYPKESPSQRTPAVKLADTLSGSNGLVLGAKDGQGISRFVSQDRKIYRIRQYLDESKESLDLRVRLVTQRPMQVPHSGSVIVNGFRQTVLESDFVIQDPNDINTNSGDSAQGTNSGL